MLALDLIYQSVLSLDTASPCNFLTIVALQNKAQLLDLTFGDISPPNVNFVDFRTVQTEMTCGGLTE